MIKEGDTFKIVKRQVGYEPISRSRMFFLNEGTAVRVAEVFRGKDYLDVERTFVTVTNLTGNDPQTVKIGTLLHAAGQLEEEDLEGRLLPWEMYSEGENVVTTTPFTALENMKAQLEAEEVAKAAAIEDPSKVMRLARVLPAPHDGIAEVGTEFRVLGRHKSGYYKVALEGRKFPIFIKKDDLLPAIAL